MFVSFSEAPTRRLRNSRSSLHRAIPSEFARVAPLLLTLLLAPGLAGAGPFTDAGHPIVSISAWATAVDTLVRGPQDIADPGLGLASFGAETVVLGEPSGATTDALSLGDGGSITVYLDAGISNGPADDFAVFENGIEDLEGLFAELAYVEVSSNGVDFARFDSDALNPSLVDGGQTIDPTDYHGFGGRHGVGLGTGFDLADLSMDPLVLNGTVDVVDVRYVRLIDVIGNGSTLDGAGRAIHDPYSTPFPTGGFDLTGVGAIHVPEPDLAGGLLVGVLALGNCRRRRRVAGGPVSRRAASAFGSAPRRLAATTATAVVLILAFASPGFALTATFDDLGLGVEDSLNGSTLPGGYTSGGIFFENVYTAAYDSFTGFAASSTTDDVTPGYGNQFSNITGSGAGGSSGFGLAYSNGRIVLPTATTVVGAEFTNTTYAARSMETGDAFAKQFGGISGDDPDFFRLLIEGIDDAGQSTGVQELMLADFRFSDNSQDYILDQWLFQDLSGLGVVKELLFSFESSDEAGGWINTPVYFAIDNVVTTPEPATAILLGFGLSLLASRRRRNAISGR